VIDIEIDTDNQLLKKRIHLYR